MAAPGLVPATTATGLGELLIDEQTGRTCYVGLGFHDLRRANATALVAAGVDIKTAQALLGHPNAQLTLGLYAQAIVSLGRRPPSRWRPGSSGRARRATDARWKRVRRRPRSRTLTMHNL